MMNVLLLCDKTVSELFPLMGELPVAQLPLLGKTIAEYHLELVCAHSKPEKVTLLGGSYQNSLSQLLGDGARWGIELSYKKALSLEQALPLLVVPCERLSSFDLGGFLQQVQAHPDQSAVGVVDKTPAVYWIAQQDDWREVLSGALCVIGNKIGNKIALPNAAVLAIDSIRAFYDANLGLLRGDFAHINLGAYEEGESLLLASRATVNPSLRQQGRAYVGAASRIGEGVTMLGQCVINQQVLVDNNATLENCVILPHSYVGNWVSVRNAIVSGPFVWRMDTGVCFRVNERFLLSQLPVSGGAGWLARWLGRDRSAPVTPVECGVRRG